MSDAKDLGVIPEAWHPFFRDTCVYCNEPLVINMARTIMKCKSPICPRRIANQADAMLKDLGYKGWGPETLTTYCTLNKIHSIAAFIENPPLPLHLVEDLNSRGLSFAKIVELLHLPNIGTKAYKLFSSYNSWKQFLMDISKAKDCVAFMADKVGGSEVGAQMLDTLLDYSDDLYRVSELITTVEPVAGVIDIAITGHITEVTSGGRGLTKDEYIAELNKLAHQCNAEFRQSGALQSVMYIVADSPSNSRKYKIGASRNVLISSGALYKMLEDCASRLGGKTNG